MSSILDYIDWRGEFDFKSSPFNFIDSLILSQLSYLNFDGFFKNGDFKESLSISTLSECFFNSTDLEKRSELGVLINPLSLELLKKAAASNRFGNIRVTGYISKIKAEKDEQFAAMTFVFGKKQNYVAFRGTDDTIIGWKEDFYLALEDEVAAQKDALRYLSTASEKLKGNFVVAGHSKGGNLAVYAGANLPSKYQKRLAAIHNFDGPGFSEEKFHSEDFKKVLPKIKSFYPQFSIIGMLFEHEGSYSVVESEESFVMQHDPFSWHVKASDFVMLDGFYKGSEFFHETFNTWLSRLSQEQQKQFIDTLFMLIESTGAATNKEIEVNILKNSVKIVNAVKSLDQEVRDALDETVVLFFKIAKKNFPPLSSLLGKTNIPSVAARKVKGIVDKISGK